MRSPTAEAVFSAYPEVNAVSAGLNPDAKRPVSADLVEWADIIFVMENNHRNRLCRKFKDLLRAKRLIVLDIPDEYDYMDPELIRILKVKVPQYAQIHEAIT